MFRNRKIIKRRQFVCSASGRTRPILFTLSVLAPFAAKETSKEGKGKEKRQVNCLSPKAQVSCHSECERK